jgi:glycosyltransferase involved in cell wall biosynthesis
MHRARGDEGRLTSPRRGRETDTAASVRPQILFVTPLLPVPLTNGGNIRRYHVLRALSAIGSITIVASDVQRDDAGLLANLYRRLVYVPGESLRWRSDERLHGVRRKVAAARRALALTTPQLVAMSQSHRASETLRRVMQDDFDLIWLERIATLAWLGPVRQRAPIFLDLDDLEHRKARHRLRTLKRTTVAYYLQYLEYLRLRRLERRLPRGPFKLVVASEADRRVLGDTADAVVIPNGVDIAPTASCAPSDPRPTLAFVGMMSYEPNIDGITWFVRHTLPLIRRSLPDVRLLIVGSDPPSQVQQLHDGDGVVVTGTVPHVEPYLASAHVAIAPLFFGGGTRIKILEAFANRRPVVTTTIGAEGLDVRNGIHLLIADEPDPFARACVSLLGDARRAEALVDNGLAFARRHDWEAVEQRIQQKALAATAR